VKLSRWLVPWKKHTDLNTVTPIRTPYVLQSKWGTIVEAFGGMWQRHVQVDDEQTILAFSAAYSCVSIISKDIGKLRPRLMQRVDGIWEEIERPASPVLRKPNRFQTHNQFFEQWVISKLVTGNTYALKERDVEKRVVALYILDPRRVMPLVAPDGEVFYQLSSDRLSGLDGGKVVVPASEIIHDRHTCLWHPLVGVGPLYAAGATATQGNRIQHNSATFFQNMSRPSGQLTTDGHISDELAARIKADYEKGFAGPNIGRLLVAGDGLKFEPFSIPAEQAQLIEQLRWTVEDVARPFHVPLYKIGAGQVPAMANVSALNLEYYQQALQPHIESIESLLDDGLALGFGLGVEFDLEGLLRMDPKTRAETAEIEVRSATVTPNEVRKKENRPPKIGGDALYLQQQNFSLEALAKRDAREDPFGSAAAPAPAANDEEDEAEEASEDKEPEARAWIALTAKLRSKREWRVSTK
jgi:HK97 family phage portal protein